MFQTIQAMRGIAAVSVAMFHFSILLADQRYLGHEVFGWLTWRGDLGVDFFFVLSGFIIIHAHQNDIGKPESWRRFAWNRATRILPLYLFVTIGACVAIALGFSQVKKLPTGAAEWLVTLGLIRIDNSAPLLTPAWSLIHEVAFYAVFSVLLFNRRLGVFLLGLWFAICLLAHPYPGPEERTPFNAYFSGFNLDFLFGILCFLASKRLVLAKPLLLVALSLALILSTVLIEAGNPGFPLYRLLYGVWFAFLLYGLVCWEIRSRPLVPKLLILIGNASFAIYLTHELLLGLLTKVAIKLTLFRFAGEAAGYVLVIVLTTAIGTLLHLGIEKPLNRFAKRLYSPG